MVDDDSTVREALRDLLEQDGRTVETYASSEAFLEAYRPGSEGCLLVDARMPGMGGLTLLQRLKGEGSRLVSIMITGQGDVPMAVEAMRAGAADFIEKPIRRDELFASIEHALEHIQDSAKLSVRREAAATRLAGLTPRQRQIMELVLAGHPSKNIAADLGISQRTVENHRAAVMKKTGSHSLSALIRLALAADPSTGSHLSADRERGAAGREAPPRRSGPIRSRARPEPADSKGFSIAATKAHFTGTLVRVSHTAGPTSLRQSRDAAAFAGIHRSQKSVRTRTSARKLPKYSENCVFATKWPEGSKKWKVFQLLRPQIRYAADQPNFSPDQRIEAAVTTE